MEGVGNGVTEEEQGEDLNSSAGQPWALNHEKEKSLWPCGLVRRSSLGHAI